MFDAQEYEKSRVMTVPANSMPEGASAWGCLHMAGNVWEWCLDHYDKEFYKSRESRVRNPFRSKGGPEKAARGGGWYNMSRDCRTTNRAGFDPGRTDPAVGFRVVR